MKDEIDYLHEVHLLDIEWLLPSNCPQEEHLMFEITLSERFIIKSKCLMLMKVRKSLQRSNAK